MGRRAEVIVEYTLMVASTSGSLNGLISEIFSRNHRYKMSLCEKIHFASETYTVCQYKLNISHFYL